MKILMMTTWNAKCGIAQHAKFFVDGLKKLGHEVVIFCQKEQEEGIDFGDDYNVIRGWSWYGRSNKVEFDKELFKRLVEGLPVLPNMSDKPVDVVHVQYESFLWHQSYLENIPDMPFVMTHHSSCTGPGCPVGRAGKNIMHFEGVQMPKMEVMPMGIPEWDFVPFERTKPQMGSFGLGRNDDEFCDNAMKLAAEQLEGTIAYTTHYGTSKWVSDEELRDVLQQSRMLALYYPPTDASVSSSAACVALATGLPVLCSNTKWFKHVKEYVHLIDSPAEMAWLICLYMSDEMAWTNAQMRAERAVKERGWSVIAKRTEEIYRSLI